jgi:hypothetical protein
MNTDTPETDHLESNLGNAAHPVLSSFCRKLERERDEARERADTMFAKHVDILDQARRERDEALELIDAVTPEIDAAYMTDLCCTLRSERDEAMEQRDRLAEAIRKHKDAFPFALDFCDVELYEALQSLTHNDKAHSRGGKS